MWPWGTAAAIRRPGQQQHRYWRRRNANSFVGEQKHRVNICPITSEAQKAQRRDVERGNSRRPRCGGASDPALRSRFRKKEPPSYVESSVRANHFLIYPPLL
ncbi:hypothetical protein MRX96_033349 [Rhipicephalus microplus]